MALSGLLLCLERAGRKIVQILKAKLLHVVCVHMYSTFGPHLHIFGPGSGAAKLILAFSNWAISHFSIQSCSADLSPRAEFVYQICGCILTNLRRVAEIIPVSNLTH